MSTMTEPQTEPAIDPFHEQWQHAMNGLDRAVAWVKEHKESLRDGFYFNLNARTGIEINIGLLWHGSDKINAVRKLFAGKTATMIRNKSMGEESYRLVDEESGLTFKWSIYFPDRSSEERETSEIIL